MYLQRGRRELTVVEPPFGSYGWEQLPHSYVQQKKEVKAGQRASQACPQGQNRANAPVGIVNAYGPMNRGILAGAEMLQCGWSHPPGLSTLVIDAL